MAKFVIVITCAVCCIFNRTLSAPIIKASGVQWSEPKGTGKGNITLIMIPQNDSCGNDSDMIVAVKSDYQILSQDTQLLNLVVNENINNKTNNISKNDTYKQSCSSLKEDSANKQEQLRHPNTAKYFESENKLPSENITNNTVNVYPLLLRNYQNLVALNGTSTTTPYNTIDILQLLNVSVSNSKYDNVNGEKLPSESQINSVTNMNNSLNSTERNDHTLMPDSVIQRNNDNSSQSMIGSDENFLKEALNILDKLKQDPSYYSKFKSNQIPSTAEIKEQGDISLSDSKTKFLKSDDSALASDEGEGLGREFRYINNENQDISNIEGNVNENVQSSTCFPFFLSVNSEQTTQDLNSQNVISFERVPLKGTGNNESQEFVIKENTSISSFTSKCKQLTPSNAFDMSQTTKTPVQSYINTSVGYGVQSNLSQNLTVNICKPSNGLYTESTLVTPLATITSTPVFGIGPAANVTSVSIDEPMHIQQTLAAANIAAGSELKATDLSQYTAVTTSVSTSGNDNSMSKNNQECSPKTSDILVPTSIQLANKAPSAGQMKSPSVLENQISKTSQPEVHAINTGIYESLPTSPAASLDGSTPPNGLGQIGQEIKSTECIQNALSQTIPPITVCPTSTANVAAGLNGLSEMQIGCVTNPNVILNQESGIPQAGVGAIPKKITLEPQISCGTMKKAESSTISHIEGQEACFKDKDLTLPLVKSSIFLANNNDMPKGKDIPISLNASLDEFTLSDLQEREDRLHGKLAELYNRNPMIFNVEREPAGKIVKPQLKYYKNEVLKMPSIYFDKIYSPGSNKMLKMNLAGKNVIFDQKPSYKSESNDRLCNYIMDKNNTFSNYEIDEPVGNDSTNVEQNPLAITTTPQVTIIQQSNVYGANEQKHLDNAVNPPDSRQPANEEDKLLTILNTLDQTTFGISSYGQLQNNVTLLDISTIPPTNNVISLSLPVNDYKVLTPQEPGQNSTGTHFNITNGQQDSENVDSQHHNVINLTTKQPFSSQKLQPKPKGRHRERICSKPNKSKTNKLKTVPNASNTSSSDDNVQDENTQTKDKMSIPADSVQKIVIEIVRNTKKPENKPHSYKVNPSYNSVREDQTIIGKKEQMPYDEPNSKKQNFVPFQSAWKPVQIIKEQTVNPQRNYIQPNSVYESGQGQDNFKTETYEYNGNQENSVQSKHNNIFYENQDTSKQAQIPNIIQEYNRPFHKTATNHDKVQELIY